MKQTTIIKGNNASQILAENHSYGVLNAASGGENFTFRSFIQIDEQINLPKRQIYLPDEFTLGETLENDTHEWKTQVTETLEDIRSEVKKAYEMDNEIELVPDSAYDDVSALLEILFNYKIPMPHIGWAEDGSLGLEWRPEDGIVTIGVYGDGLIIYCAFFSDECQIKGICALSNTAVLSGFLETLLNLHFE